MAASPSRPLASPLQRFQGHSSIPSPSTSYAQAPLPAEGRAGAGPSDAPRLKHLSPDDKVAFSVFPLGNAEVRWRCFRNVPQTAKEDAVLALESARRSVSSGWSGQSDADDELEEGQEESSVPQRLVFTRSLLATLVPFAPKMSAKLLAGSQLSQPQPPQPSPESIGGVASSAPKEAITGKEDGGEFWVFHVKTEQQEATLAKDFNALHEHLPSTLNETSSGAFRLADLFPPLPATGTAKSTSLAHILPSVHLRKIHPLFMAAARERMLAKLVANGQLNGARALRCGSSVVLYTGTTANDGDADKTGREWGEAWTTSATAEADRSLLQLTFALDLLPSPHNAILFVPHLQRIPFLPLSFHPNLRHLSLNPPPRPIPVRLLPSDTSAFYLRSSSSAPAEADAAAFWDAVAQSGARRAEAGREDWAVCWVPAPDDVGLKNGTLLLWDAQLILVDGKTVELPLDLSPRSASSQLKTTPNVNLNADGGGALLAAASSSGPSSTSLADSWRRLTSKTAHHFSPHLPTPPDSTEASSPPREIVGDEFEDLALSAASYLEGIIKAREQERERLEAEKENERRRKEGGGTQTSPVSDPNGSPEGSDDLWGSPPATEVVPPPARTSSTILHLPSVSLPPRPPVTQVQAEASEEPQPPPPPPQITSAYDPGGAEGMMDWSWDAPTGSDPGGMRTFGVDPLGGLQDESSWGGPEQVTEDDFDFFDAVPLQGVEPLPLHSFSELQSSNPTNASEQVVSDAQAASASTSYVDPNFSLSPMPTFPPQEGEAADFNLTHLIEGDMAAPSPLDFSTFNTNPAGTPGAVPSPHPAAQPSPAPVAVGRTPKTPKTSFSPFVDVVGEADENQSAPTVSEFVQVDSKHAPFQSTGPLALYIPRAFQPIPFGKTHAEADGKYGVGKFTFPALRQSDDEPLLSLPTPGRKAFDWQSIGELRTGASFKALLARASTPPADQDEQVTPLALDVVNLDVRQVYDRSADPRIGVIGRLKRQLKRQRLTTAEKAPVKRLVLRDTPFHRSPPPEGVDQSDDSDNDDASVARHEGPRSTAGGSDLDLLSHLRKNDIDPPIGRHLLAHLSTGVFPSETVPLPTTVNRSAYAYGPPPSISTPMPLSALTPGPMAASTPAWAPTPTSPSYVPPPLKEYSKDAMTAFTSWLVGEVVSNPNMLSSVLNAAPDAPSPPQLLHTDLSAGTQVFQLQTTRLSGFLDPSASGKSSSTVRPVDQPKLAVGFQGKILKVTAEALAFWGKIRLEPVGGKKDVAAFVVYESTGPGMNSTVGKWLANLGQTYETQGFGRHVAASLGGVQNGLVAVDPHQLTESLRPLLLQLNTHPHAVLYILTPPNLLSAAFDLREVQQQLEDLLGPRDHHVLVQLVPYAEVLEPAVNSSTGTKVAQVVYDRLTRRVDRLVPRKIFESAPTEAHISFPAFHLARAHPPALPFQLKWPPPPLNLLDHHAFLHVGYAVTDDGEWLVGCAVDERGQAQQSFSMRLDGSDASTVDAVANEVYNRASRFARQADAEWRVVITRLGQVGVDELMAWDRLLLRESANESQALHFFVTAAQQHHLEPFLLSVPSRHPPSLPPTTSSSAPFVLDAHNTGSILSPSYRSPFPLAGGERTASKYGTRPTPSSTVPQLLPLSSFTIAAANPSASSAAASSQSFHLTSHLLLVNSTPSVSAPPPTADFTAFISDLANSYHALSVLTQHRWHTAADDADGRLPLHLAAVARMLRAQTLLKSLLP